MHWICRTSSSLTLTQAAGRQPGGFGLGGAMGREKLAGIVEHHDPVAQQAPSLLRMACSRVRSHVVGRIRWRALGVVVAHAFLLEEGSRPSGRLREPYSRAGAPSRRAPA